MCSGLSFGTDAPPGEYLSIYMFAIMLDPVLIHIGAILLCCWPAWAGLGRVDQGSLGHYVLEAGRGRL